MFGFGLNAVDFLVCGADEMVGRLTLEGQHPDLSARQTLFNVYRAKKTAESVNDVGQGTDLWIVRQDRAFEFDTAAMEQLGAVLTAYEEAQRNVPGLDRISDGNATPVETERPGG